MDRSGDWSSIHDVGVEFRTDVLRRDQPFLSQVVFLDSIRL